MRSLSSWRAWIEMRILLSTCKRRPSRSPHGERGLKYRRVLAGVFAMLSLSSWRAWIEIKKGKFFSFTVRSLSSWRAWIEIPPA